MRLHSSLKTGAQQACTWKEESRHFPAKAGLGPAMIEGPSDTLLLCPLSRVTELKLSTCPVPQAAGTTIPQIVYIFKALS